MVADVSEAVHVISAERQALVLRAFALYFQLANIAEQQHRIRRRREDAHAGRVARDSLERAFELLADVPADELARRARDVSCGSCSPRTRPRRAGEQCCSRTCASPKSSIAWTIRFSLRQDAATSRSASPRR